MIDRYTNPQMGAIWAEPNKYRRWLDVEIAVCEAWARLGKVPAAALKTIKDKAAFDPARIEEIEKVVKHDIIAFLSSVAEYVGPDSRFIHMGLTSYDIVDTSLSLLIRESLQVIRGRLTELKKVVRREALKHKKTVCMGRTHGIHAEPVTFGFKLLVWYEEIKRHIDRVDRALEVIGVGRISGSVGTYIHLDPRVEVTALRRLGLKPAPVSTQVLQRDRHAEVVATLALIATTLEKFALEIRHLQRSEVLEVEEPFTKGQKGSSSMPHKKNPVRCERLSGMARLVRGNVQVALENIPLWHERDISHSSAERIILPDSFILADFMLTEAIDILKHWKVLPKNMLRNIQSTRGLVFSQMVLLALTRKGMVRDQAYELVQRNTLKAWNEGLDFKTLVCADPDIRARLTAEEIEASFDIKPYLGKIDYIFERVLGHES